MQQRTRYRSPVRSDLFKRTSRFSPGIASSLQAPKRKGNRDIDANRLSATFSSLSIHDVSRVISNTGTQLDSFEESERADLKQNVWHSGVSAAIVFHKTVKRPVVKRGGLTVAVLPFRFPANSRETRLFRVFCGSPGRPWNARCPPVPFSTGGK